MKYKYIDLIIELYKNGKSFKEISKYLNNLSERNIKKYIYAYLEEYKDYDIIVTRLNNISSEDLYILYKKGFKNYQIARFYNITTTQVLKKITDYCDSHGLQGPKRNYKKSKIDLEQIINDYKNGISMSDLAKKYNVSQTTISRNLSGKLSKQELYEIHHKRIFHYTATGKDFVNLYEAGFLLKDIEKCLNTTSNKIKELLTHEYSKQGKNIPKIIRQKAFLTLVDNYNQTPEKIVEDAKKVNRVVPQYYINEYKGITLDVNKIREFVTNLAIEHKEDKAFTDEILKNIEFSILLKNKNYDFKHQVTALINNILKSEYSSISEVIDLVNGDVDVLKASLLLNGNNAINKKDSEIAYNIKKEQKKQEATKIKSNDNDER